MPDLSRTRVSSAIFPLRQALLLSTCGSEYDKVPNAFRMSVPEGTYISLSVSVLALPPAVSGTVKAISGKGHG